MVNYFIIHVPLIFANIDSARRQLPIVIVQYSFELGKALLIKGIPPTCKDHPYIHTQHSTLVELTKMLPKAAVKDMYDKAGEILSSKTLSEVPRDRRQAYNAAAAPHQ